MPDIRKECAEAASLWKTYSEAEKCPTFSRGDSRHWADLYTRAAEEIRQLQNEVDGLRKTVSVVRAAVQSN